MLEEESVTDPGAVLSRLRPAPRAPGRGAARDAGPTAAMPFRHPDRSPRPRARASTWRSASASKRRWTASCLEALVRSRRAARPAAPAADNAATGATTPPNVSGFLACSSATCHRPDRGRSASAWPAPPPARSDEPGGSLVTTQVALAPACCRTTGSASTPSARATSAARVRSAARAAAERRLRPRGPRTARPALRPRLTDATPPAPRGSRRPPAHGASGRSLPAARLAPTAS